MAKLGNNEVVARKKCVDIIGVALFLHYYPCFSFFNERYATPKYRLNYAARNISPFSPTSM